MLHIIVAYLYPCWGQKTCLYTPNVPTCLFIPEQRMVPRSTQHRQYIIPKMPFPSISLFAIPCQMPWDGSPATLCCLCRETSWLLCPPLLLLLLLGWTAVILSWKPHIYTIIYIYNLYIIMNNRSSRYFSFISF